MCHRIVNMRFIKFFTPCRSLRDFLCVLAFGCLLPSIGYTQVSLDWTARYSGPSNAIDQAHAIAVDASGNTYVTGGADRNEPALGGDIVTAKYDADGNQVWTARYENPGALADAPTAITLDGTGHVYVTGYSHGHSSIITAQDYVTLKYSPNGVQLWAARYSAPTNSPSGARSVDYPRAIAVDSSGSVYVTGSTSDSAGQSRDYATVKYDSNGNQLWAAIYDGSDHSSDSATCLAVNGQGEVYVGGYSALVKYDPEGNQLWIQLTPVSDVALDLQGNVVTAGPSLLESSDDGEQSDFQIAKYRPDGERLWRTLYDGGIGESDSATYVRLDRVGNIYVSGNSASRCDWVTDDGHLEKVCDTVISTLKLAPDGQQLWAARYASADQTMHFPVGLELDTAGNVYVVGSEGPWSRTVTLKYASNGTRLWGIAYRVPNHGWDSPAGIAISATGGVYVAGSSHWNDGASSDYFVLKYTQTVEPPFHLHSPWKSAQEFGFEVDSASVLPFVIETSVNLQDWSVVATNSSPTSGNPVTFPIGTDARPRFFRVRSMVGTAE